MRESIFVKGARENNLKNVDVEIPRDKLVVLTGISGSGKSSLAFDTIYAEGQRRYMESLSSYARQFLGADGKNRMWITLTGCRRLFPSTRRQPQRIPDPLSVPLRRFMIIFGCSGPEWGVPHCPNCGKEIRQQTIDQIIDQVMSLREGTRIQVLAPVVRARKGEHQKVFEDARKSGYVRVRADGSLYELSEEIRLDKNKKHSIEVVIDRLVMKKDVVRRLADSVETASALSRWSGGY